MSEDKQKKVKCQKKLKVFSNGKDVFHALPEVEKFLLTKIHYLKKHFSNFFHAIVLVQGISW